MFKNIQNTEVLDLSKQLLFITMEESDGQSNDIENYNATAKYWDRIPATVDGMLGGYGFISNIDIKGSASFLHKVFQVCTLNVLIKFSI